MAGKISKPTAEQREQRMALLRRGMPPYYGSGGADAAFGQVLSHVLQYTDPCQVPENVWRAEWISGRHGAHARYRIGQCEKDAPFTLPGGRVTLQATDDRDGATALVQEGDGWLLYARRYDPGRGDGMVGVSFAVCAATEQRVEELAKVISAGFRDGPATSPDEATVTFWCAGENSARKDTRIIAVPAWEQISGNYTAALLAPLGQLMAWQPDDRSARTVLLHGPAGTGKTTLLRALARAWKPWCSVQYVLDAARFLGDSSYLTQVMLDEDFSREAEGKWRLVILEDCGKLLRGDRGDDDALSSLLNLGDGMLGQGQKLLFALTTNDERGRLDAKLTRPGRCLASLHVTPLERGEAQSWLGRPLPADVGTDLASLYQLRDGTGITAAEPLAPVGAYL